jgi:hypothetical protein
MIGTILLLVTTNAERGNADPIRIEKIGTIGWRKTFPVQRGKTGRIVGSCRIVLEIRVYRFAFGWMGFNTCDDFFRRRQCAGTLTSARNSRSII